MFQSQSSLFHCIESVRIVFAMLKTHVSHQNLSKYIKNLKQEYRITLFTRRSWPLTEAAEAMLETMRELVFFRKKIPQIRLEDPRIPKQETANRGARKAGSHRFRNS